MNRCDALEYGLGRRGSAEWIQPCRALGMGSERDDRPPRRSRALEFRGSGIGIRVGRSAGGVPMRDVGAKSAGNGSWSSAVHPHLRVMSCCWRTQLGAARAWILRVDAVHVEESGGWIERAEPERDEKRGTNTPLSARIQRKRDRHTGPDAVRVCGGRSARNRLRSIYIKSRGIGSVVSGLGISKLRSIAFAALKRYIRGIRGWVSPLLTVGRGGCARALLTRTCSDSSRASTGR
jgi:hypothetical protein